jgi:hypothetical protein
LYGNDLIDTMQLCTLLADLVWRAMRREDTAAQFAIAT